MSLSQPFASSASVSPGSTRRRRKSRFTFKHLSQLGVSSTICPLRIIAHLDLDAFYAQCEMIRLGIPEDQPLAVQQWQGLIAINYPARKYGLSRHVTITEAQSKCPDIILQHVATWKEGEDKWAYHDDAFQHIATHKVSLDPYRLQSRKILATIKNFLPPAPVQRVEKASVDEVFLDLSAQIHALLLERFPELRGPPPYDDPTEKLPALPTSALDWNADALVDLDTGQSEQDDPDWDDMAMLIGSEILRSLRAQIRTELGFTCSAGISCNKMLAKLGSGHKKPNQQTIIRNRAIKQFLGEFKFTKIRNLGGKLGDEVVSMFNTDSVTELLEIPLEQLKKKLGNETGVWLYQTIRGEDHSDVNPRTQIKSMLSAKSFRPTINTFEQGVGWLRIFAADIYSRLVEEGVTENKRRPRTINLHHRQGGQTRSKQSPIPPGKTISEPLLLDLAKNLLAQIIVEGRAWPCANLSLSVGGFEDGITGNRGIGGFLVHGEEAKALQHQAISHKDSSSDRDEPDVRTNRKRGAEEALSGRINKYFIRQESNEDASRSEVDDETLDSHFADFNSIPSAQTPSYVKGKLRIESRIGKSSEDADQLAASSPFSNQNEESEDERHGIKVAQQSAVDTIVCSRCQKAILPDQQEEHDDWHFAKDLQEQEQGKNQTPLSKGNLSRLQPSRGKGKRGRGRPAIGRDAAGSNTGGKQPEKGQKRLAF